MRFFSQINYMRKSSQKSNPALTAEEGQARAPSRERGRLRVEALLGAAASVFEEKGFGASTMTAIAAAAGSSIGSLYQFFPTKEALAQELLRVQTDDLSADLAALESRAKDMTTQALGDALSTALVTFRAAHPSFAKLIETPGVPAELADGVRKHMRLQLVSILQAHFPQLPDKKVATMAAVVQQLMKSAVQLHGELGPTARAAALQEIGALMRLYLQSSGEAV